MNTDLIIGTLPIEILPITSVTHNFYHPESSSLVALRLSILNTGVIKLYFYKGTASFLNNMCESFVYFK